MRPLQPNIAQAKVLTYLQVTNRVVTGKINYAKKLLKVLYFAGVLSNRSMTDVLLLR